MNYLAELKRRNIFRVAIAYLALSWVTLQIADVVVPALGLPEIIITSMVVIGIIGFPFALFFTWAFELTPEGIKKTTEVNLEESTRATTGQKINYTIIGLMAIAITFLIYDRGGEAADKEIIAEEQIESRFASNSIAVLPFVNMSSDPEQEYFSDGISEELLNVLAQIKDLKVTSRTSSFQFKGTEQDLPSVAAQLGVSKILEGSVRKSGNRIRITAQLIEAETDVHLWSETYDRDLTDIFAVQDEISRAIVDALKTTLNIDVAAVNYEQGTENTDAHEQYMLGIYNRNKNEQESFKQAKIHFENAVALDPAYAEAWAHLAVVCVRLSDQRNNNGTVPFAEAIEDMEVAVDKAITLNPDLAEVQWAQGLYYWYLNENTAALGYLRRAVEINPNFAEGLRGLAQTYRRLNRFQEERETLEIAVKIDPMSLNVKSNLASAYARENRFDETRVIIEQMKVINNNAQTTIDAEFILYGQMGQNYKTIELYRAKVNQGIEFDDRVLFKVALDLTKIGLNEQSLELMVGKRDEIYNFYLNQRYDQFIKSARVNYSENSINPTEADIRALAELVAENFPLAEKLIEVKDPCSEPMNYRMCFSLLSIKRKLEKTDEMAEIFDIMNDNFERAKQDGLELDVSYAINKSIALLMVGQTDQGIEILKSSQTNLTFVTPDAFAPIFKELHDHPYWQENMADYKAWQTDQQAKLAELKAVRERE